MTPPVQTLIDALVKGGWRVEIQDSETLEIPDNVLKRYPSLPYDVVSFLRSVSHCVNPTETAWFLCVSDYDGHSDAAFRWNEFELQSLHAAEGDEAWTSQVATFWSKTFPILLSVKTGYVYLALNLTQSNGEYGSVVYGREPEYEETTEICGSFAELCHLISTLLLKGVHDPVISDVL